MSIRKIGLPKKKEGGNEKITPLSPTSISTSQEEPPDDNTLIDVRQRTPSSSSSAERLFSMSHSSLERINASSQTSLLSAAPSLDRISQNSLDRTEETVPNQGQSARPRLVAPVRTVSLACRLSSERLVSGLGDTRHHSMDSDCSTSSHGMPYRATSECNVSVPDISLHATSEFSASAPAVPLRTTSECHGRVFPLFTKLESSLSAPAAPRRTTSHQPLSRGTSFLSLDDNDSPPLSPKTFSDLVLASMIAPSSTTFQHRVQPQAPPRNSSLMHKPVCSDRKFAMNSNSKWADVKEAVSQREVLLAKRGGTIPRPDLSELDGEEFQRGPGPMSDELVRKTVRVGECRIQVNLPAPEFSYGK